MRVRVIRQMFQLQGMIGKPRPDLLTLSTTFYDLSVSRNLFSKAEIRQFGESVTEGLNPYSLHVLRNNAYPEKGVLGDPIERGLGHPRTL